MTARAAIAVVVVAAATAATALAAHSAPHAAAARVVLTVTYDDGAGRRSVAHLRCGRTQRADGFLRTRRRRACAHARRHATFLAGRPPLDRQCTQIYGGPQTARVRGTIGSRSVNRRFTRRDGCEISDWDRAVPLIPKPSS